MTCRHTSRFLLCYIHCIPLLLWPLAEWGSPVLAVMISFLVLGIEGISSYIEEPFHVSLVHVIVMDSCVVVGACSGVTDPRNDCVGTASCSRACI
jgi:predicted membrane chloride channel (bestrophin family)